MVSLLKRTWLRDLLVGLMIVVAMLGLILYPRESSGAVREGLRLCLDVIIPSLFPFFVLSTLVVELGLARYLGRALEGVMRPLFRVSGACSVAVTLGFLGGYPIGARTAISLYEKKLCSRVEAERLLAFCNNSGPAFILGAVGAGILGSSHAGWLLFLSHTAASLMVGLLFRFYKFREAPSLTVSRQQGEVLRLPAVFGASVKSSFSSVFYICAFILFFTVVVQLLYVSGLLPGAAGMIARLLEPLDIQAAPVQDVLTGLIELTSGLWSLEGSASAHLVGKMAMAAFMLGWAGLSVHCQVLSFIGQSGLTPWTYIGGKLLHGIFSAVCAFMLATVTGMDAPTDAIVAGQVEQMARLSFGTTLWLTLCSILAVTAGFLLVAGCMLLRKPPKARRFKGRG